MAGALSQSQIAMYAQSAGLSPDRAQIAAAIAMAESGGRPTAHNPVPPDDSYGLWQINMIGSMGPARRAQYGISSNTDLYDPAVNARAMAAISNGGKNFTPWSTYTSGAYKKFSGGAADATATDASWQGDLGGALGGLLGGGTAGLQGLAALGELGVGAAEWLGNPHNWIRIIETVVGALMVGVGLAIVTRGTWQPAVNAVGKVAEITPQGRVVATAKAAKAANAVKTAGTGQPVYKTKVKSA